MVCAWENPSQEASLIRRTPKQLEDYFNGIVIVNVTRHIQPRKYELNLDMGIGWQYMSELNYLPNSVPWMYLGALTVSP